MTLYVFIGPTLSREEARGELNAVYLPPVTQGDVYRVGLLRPEAIGIIDGYFDRVPAVWHKEILWAMARGIHVYGSASMGALRAAELAPFGMIGVGEIFGSYRDGVLEDDDEVAVAHGSAETGYQSFSVAMVNIRKTLAKANANDIISATTRATLERIAKSLFYPERSYKFVMQLAIAQGLSATEARDFNEWLPRGQVDQKRQDALAMLCTMREQVSNKRDRRSVSYKVEHTVFWDDLILQAGVAETSTRGQLKMLRTEAILDELRLNGAAYLEFREQALLRDLALREARHMGYRVDRETVQRKIIDWRETNGLRLPGELDNWLEENDLSHAGLDALIEEETLINRVLGESDQACMRIQDDLRVKDGYRKFRARALDKQRRLEAAGLQNPSLEMVGITSEDLLRWYFRRQGPFLAPDPKYYARTLGFEHVEAFLLAVLREFCYMHLKESETQPENSRPDG